MEKQLIDFFKKCIHKHEREGRRTRVSNIVGHLAKRQAMREWFYERYPSPTDWINFFYEHPNHFSYDEKTGNFRVKLMYPSVSQTPKQIQK